MTISVRPFARHGVNILAIALTLCVSATAPAQQNIRTINTRYYTLHTDLDDASVREATLRITLLAEEYHRRTRGLAGTVNNRLPFYLFKDLRAYYSAGGIPGSVGFFTGERLAAYVPENAPEQTWSTVQHEGFHQFILAAVGRGIPIWANEGLAEYFSEGVWTGDQFLIGFVPPDRLARVKAMIAKRQYRSLYKVLHMDHELWNMELDTSNYDQAWSMVHFLAHADEGRYQQPFLMFLRDVSNGHRWDESWVNRFGGNVDAFENRWREYWQAQSDHPTFDLYAQATNSTLTSFFARAFARRQKFESFADFARTGQSGELKIDVDDWLPPRLLLHALAAAPTYGEWWLEHRPGRHLLLCRTKTGTVLEGSFKLKRSRVDSITVKPVRRTRR